MGNFNIRLFFAADRTVYKFWITILLFFLSFGVLYYLTTMVPRLLNHEAENGVLSSLVKQACAMTTNCQSATARIGFSDRHYHLMMDASGSGRTHQNAMEANLRQAFEDSRSDMGLIVRWMIFDAKVGDLNYHAKARDTDAGKSSTARIKK